MNPFDLQRDAFGRWVLVLADGTRHSPVTAVRAYPVSAPDQGVALMDADGHELQWVPNLLALAPDLQATLREAVDEREFLPQILRLDTVSSLLTPSTWTVQTVHDPRFGGHGQTLAQIVGSFSLSDFTGARPSPARAPRRAI